METLFTGRDRIEPAAVPSTNSYALELLKNGLPHEGTVIITRHQTQGRGQRGNAWESEAGMNITASFIFYPSFIDAQDQFILNKMVSLALTDTLLTLLTKEMKDLVRIKWPNDLYVGGKKIAGILIENVLRKNTLAASVIGIGLNVNQRFEDKELNAVSLKDLAGTTFDIETVFEQLCGTLEARYLQLKAGKREIMDRDYLARLYQLHKKANYRTGEVIREGIISGVSKTGKLQVEFSGNKKEEFEMKAIAFL